MIIIMISLFNVGLPNSSRLINADHLDTIVWTNKTEFQLQATVDFVGE